MDHGSATSGAIKIVKNIFCKKLIAGTFFFVNLTCFIDFDK